MKDLGKFLKWTYVDNLDIILEISGKGFIDSQPVVADDLIPLIGEWLIHGRDIICTVDLSGTNLMALNIRASCKLINDIDFFTKDGNNLKSITFIGSGRLLRTIYWAAQFAIPYKTRKIITFA
jgi:hypothetical protein